MPIHQLPTLFLVDLLFNQFQTVCRLPVSVMNAVGKPTTTSWVVAAGFNAAVLGYVSYKLYRNAVVQQEKHRQLKRSAQRLWKLATQVWALTLLQLSV